MKKLLSIILAAILTITMFTSCADTAEALTSVYLNLGEKYLTDLDYEEAIVYFNKVIEVEPKNARAYLGSAEAYVAMGDIDSAIAILEQGIEVADDPTELEAMLAELLGEGEAETDEEIITNEEGEIEPVAETKLGILDNDMIRNPVYFEKSTITEIDFLDSLENAPEDAWDFSLDGDGSVLGWLDRTHLYIASDGGVIAGEDASYLFGTDISGLSYSDYNEHFMTNAYTSLKAIRFNNSLDTSNVTNMSYMFSVYSMYGFQDFITSSELLELDVSGIDTSNVTDMSGMFYSCVSLTSIDVGEFDTSNVTDMSDMFNTCETLESIDLSGFNTSNLVDMHGMFSNCTSLSTIDLSDFDTSKVVDLSYIFMYCRALASVNLSGFDTSNVTDMTGMFEGCTSLTSLDLSSFNTSKVTSMWLMFSTCRSLTSLDLSNFDTSNVTDMRAMFFGCTSLTSLDISNFDTTNADTSIMFANTIWG